jgi:CDP-glucose 4,6-dehydratase
VVLNPAFWKGRRVLVTGHTGFKGSWLALWLQQAGASLTGFALAPSSEPNLFTLAGVADGMSSRLGDVRDLHAVTQAVSEAQPEVVFHLAAQSLVRPSYAAPVDTFATNVMGTVHVLEAARRVPCLRSIVVVTSDKCYENREWPWGYRETDALGGRDPYSASKGAVEIVTAAYRSSFFASRGAQAAGVATARAGNVIGGGDFAEDRVLPDCTRAASAGRAVVLRNPDAVRPWQFVLEPLAGYLALAETAANDPGRYSAAWNFGPHEDDARSVRALAEPFARSLSQHVRRQLDVAIADGSEMRLHEAGILRLDIGKSLAHLPWRPQLDIDTAIEWTARWYAAHLLGGDVAALTRQQIADYRAMSVSAIRQATP